MIRYGPLTDAVSAIRAVARVQPAVGIVLGTGLSALCEAMTVQACIPYADLPHFAHTTAMGHPGNLLLGSLGDVNLAVLQGRFHRYEGYSREQIMFPVRVIGGLGIQLLIVSNAAGGLNPRYRVGDVMILDGHLDLLGGHRYRPIGGDGPNERYPSSVPRAVGPYDGRWIDVALGSVGPLRLSVHRGVYAAMSGPTYETRAEYRWLRAAGADAVGMSTIPEVMAAAESSIPVLAMSAISNVCRPDRLASTSGHAVLAGAEMATPCLQSIVHGILAAVRADNRHRR